MERPVFIIGAPRSGTSVLFSVLRRSTALARWPGEAHEVWEADLHPALRGWDSNVATAADASEEVAGRIRRSFFLVTGPRRRLLEKSPRNSLRVPFVDSVFPDAVFVHLVRDGRDNVNSLINAWRTSRYRTYRLPEPHSIPGTDPNWWKFVLYPGWRQDTEGPLEVVCARQWVEANEHALAGLAALDPVRTISVRYESLVARPVEEVGRIVDFLGFDLEPAVRAAAESLAGNPVNVVTAPEPGKWRRENPREIDAVEALLAPTMAKLGYA